MHFSTLTAALALASSTIAVPTFGLDARQATALNEAMKARGRSYIGTSLTIRNDNTEQNIIKGPEFGSITPENAMKWDATEPNRGQFSFGNADQIANFATQNGKQMRCHTLVWHSQLPGWVNNINNNATLISVMENHIKTVMGRYKGKCTHWDVVNEALEENGSWRNSVFRRVIGEAFIPIAFRMAAAADPAAKLYYNDCTSRELSTYKTGMLTFSQTTLSTARQSMKALFALSSSFSRTVSRLTALVYRPISLLNPPAPSKPQLPASQL